MDWQITPIVIMYFLSAALTALVGMVGWFRRSVAGALPFALLLWSVASWTFFNALEYAAIGTPSKILFSKLEYIGIAAAPVLFLIFSLTYARRESLLTGPLLAFLWTFASITFVLVISNEHHQLIWSQITPSSEVPGAFLIYDHGLWFWIHFAFTYVLMLASTITLIRVVIISRFVIRTQASFMVIAAFAPWIGNIVYLFDLSPIPGLDWTPLGFAVSGILMGWAVLGVDLFNVVPVARESVFDSMLDGVIVLDEFERVADANHAAQSMLGFEHDKLIGIPVHEAMPSWKNLLDALKESRSFKVELQPDPNRRWFVDVTVSDVYDRRGNNAGRAIVLRDITRRKDLERARDNLVHTMVHDLRNPLSSIVFSLDMLRQGGGLSEEASATLEIARTNTERMLTMVNAILEIHRLENGELPLRRELSSLHSIAENRIRAQTSMVREKKILLVNRISATMPQLMIDPALIGRVIQNLLDNAIKFTPEGGMIEIVAEEDIEQSLVRVSIMDNGPGISASVQSRLFEKFATSGVQRGAGLGLAFCKQAIEAHGGTIGADAASRGTKFTFTLPLKNQA